VRTRLGFLCLLSAAALSAADDTPAWLKDLANVQLPQYDAKVDTVVLLNEQHAVASTDGRITTTTRTAVKMLNQQGFGVAFSDDYFTDGGKVRDFRAWMLPPSGKVKKYGKDEIVDLACVDNDIYNECRKRYVSGRRDAETGAIFAYESVIEQRVYFNQISFAFQESSPVRLARMQVTVPTGWTVTSTSFNGAPKQPAPQGDTYTWQMENVPELKHEEASPGYGSLAPWIGIDLNPPGDTHAVHTWEDAAKALGGFHEGQYEPAPAVIAKAKSLVEGAATELDKIRAIGRFTQQVKYTAIQVNVSRGGGYRPHHATMTFEKLYGDCKDKANLTRAMLKAVGIQAYPVAIYSGDRTHVTRDWPSLGAFNHAISAIRVGPETKAPAVLEDAKLGRLLFFDPTDPYVTPGYLPDHEQASLALVAIDGGGLIRVPAAAPAAVQHERSVEAKLAADGSLSGSFVDKRTGEELGDARSHYRTESRPDYDRYVERWVGRSIPAGRATDIKVADTDNEFTLEAKFTSQRFAQKPQAQMMIFKPALLNNYDVHLTEKTRKYPVVLDADCLLEKTRVDLPDGFKVDELPDAVKLESPFGKFNAAWTTEGNAVLFQRTFELPAQTVPVERYNDLKKFLDRVANAADSPVVLMKK
jgi:hypothetical protein